MTVDVCVCVFVSAVVEIVAAAANMDEWTAFCAIQIFRPSIVFIYTDSHAPR